MPYSAPVYDRADPRERRGGTIGERLGDERPERSARLPGPDVHHGLPPTEDWPEPAGWPDSPRWPQAPAARPGHGDPPGSRAQLRPGTTQEPDAPPGADARAWPQVTEEPGAGARPSTASPAGRRPGGRDRWADPFADSGAELPSWALLEAPPGRRRRPAQAGQGVLPGPALAGASSAMAAAGAAADGDVAGVTADRAGAGPPGGARAGAALDAGAAAATTAAGAGTPDAAGPRDGLRRSRVAVGKQRRSRRRILRWGIAALVVILLAAGIAWVARPRPAVAHGDGFVSVLQHGDLRSIPNACRVLAGSTLSSDLAGARGQRMVQPNAGPLLSQCSYTVDAPPVFRVLQVSLQAFRPSLLATGDGSADANAADAYAMLEHQLASPARKTHLPPAAMTTLTGLGQAGFSALQVIRSGGDVNDLVTVAVRDRNVLATVTLQALAHASKGQYGPVSAGQLRAATLASARAVLARAAAGPAVS